MQTATVRLVRPITPCSRIDAATSHKTYRPLVIGCIRLLRSAARSGEWLVPVVPTGWLWPRAWAAASRSRPAHGPCRTDGRHGGDAANPPARSATQRLCLGLLCGADLRPLSEDQPALQLQHCDADIYGWSLLYQPQRLGGPGGGLAAVDPNPDVPELPAFYESPLELYDRLDFLDRRGIPARPLALVTRPEDFVMTDPQLPGHLPYHRNRFIPEGRFRPPADLSRLAGA